MRGPSTTLGFNFSGGGSPQSGATRCWRSGGTIQARRPGSEVPRSSASMALEIPASVGVVYLVSSPRRPRIGRGVQLQYLRSITNAQRIRRGDRLRLAGSPGLGPCRPAGLMTLAVP